MKTTAKSRKLQKEVTKAIGDVLENDYGWEVRCDDLRCENCENLFGIFKPNYCGECGTKTDNKEADYDHEVLWKAFLAGLKKFNEK